MFGWFKKKTAPPEKLSADAEQFTLDHALSEMLISHGLDVQTYNGWLLAHGELPGLRATHYVSKQDDTGTLLHLDFELRLDSERTIVESYAGWGDTENQALSQGLFKFCTGAFHVFLSAFWNHHEPDQVDIESWTIGDTQWNAFISGVINNTSEGQKAGLPKDYMDRLQRAISSHTLPDAEHWISVFFANLKGEMTAEVRLDNEIDAELTNALTAMEWPIAEGFYSQRQFIFLRKADMGRLPLVL